MVRLGKVSCNLQLHFKLILLKIIITVCLTKQGKDCDMPKNFKLFTFYVSFSVKTNPHHVSIVTLYKLPQFFSRKS